MKYIGITALDIIEDDIMPTTVKKLEMILQLWSFRKLMFDKMILSRTTRWWVNSCYFKIKNSQCFRCLLLILELLVFPLILFSVIFMLIVQNCVELWVTLAAPSRVKLTLKLWHMVLVAFTSIQSSFIPAVGYRRRR